MYCYYFDIQLNHPYLKSRDHVKKQFDHINQQIQFLNAFLGEYLLSSETENHKSLHKRSEKIYTEELKLFPKLQVSCFYFCLCYFLQ